MHLHSDNRHVQSPPSLFTAALQCLQCEDPLQKCQWTEATCRALDKGELHLACSQPPLPIATPGRPPRPRLVAPRDLPQRKLGNREGRATLLHALTHIEFNAINLAWDAVYRFRNMPAAFYTDWARVAREEARHFRLLCDCLQDLGYVYGDFDAHDGLWEMACKTAHDPLVRMALVPRVLEARGLDVTPGILERLRRTGDMRAVNVLEIILHDEIGHVEIGTRWFRYLCEQRELPADATFLQLLKEYMHGRVKRPFHYEARERAGFNQLEMQHLEELASAGRE
jgi:uncharacterized ferritin-like protein (DUF455 family)